MAIQLKSYVRQTQLQLRRLVRKIVVLVRQQTNQKSFNLLPNSENKFEVHPPLKPGVDAWARLTCAIRPCEILFDLEADVPWYVSQKYSSIIDYVVYRALGTEHESQTSRAISEARRRAFLENLGYVSAVEKQISK